MRRILISVFAALTALLLLSACADVYGAGDTPDDFTAVTYNGTTVTLSGLLEEYDAVLVNFWFAGCGPCGREMPALESAYERYADRLAVVALTPYDDNDKVAAYAAERGLTFAMGYDGGGLTASYVDVGFPTSALIDRNGVICWRDCGAITDDRVFELLFSVYTAADYSEPLVVEDLSPLISMSSGRTVTVTDADGAPIEGVVLSVCDDETCLQLTTDADGRVSFDDPGWVRVVRVLRADGYVFDPAAEYAAYSLRTLVLEKE